MRRSASGHDRSATKYVQVCICGDTTSNLCLLAFLEFTKCPKHPNGNSNGPTAPIWCALFVGRRARLASVVRLKMLNLHNSEYSQLASVQNLGGRSWGAQRLPCVLLQQDTLAEWLRRRPATPMGLPAWARIPQVSFLGEVFASGEELVFQAPAYIGYIHMSTCIHSTRSRSPPVGFGPTPSHLLSGCSAN